jgi:hypothetical protein
MTSKHILTDVMNLINALPGNSFLNMNTGNNRRETVFFVVRTEQKDGAMGNLLPGIAAVNTHPQQWEMVFSMGSIQRSYLKDKQHYEFSSEFSVEDSHGRFIVED